MGYAISLDNTTEAIRFLIVLTSDHITGATGVTPTVTIAKNNGSFASPAGTVSEVGNGVYQIAAHPTDADTLGPLWVHATATACDPCDDQFDVVDYDPTVARISSFAATSTAAISALTIINGAFDLCGVKAQGESVSGPEAIDGLRRLNNMVGQWATQRLTIPFILREVFDVTANTGEYSIGDGADLDTVRPLVVSGAALLLNSTTPGQEIPCPLLTDDLWQLLPNKELTSTLFTTVYYNPTFASGWGTIHLWPIPTTADNDLVLYLPQQIGYFVNLTDLYDFPTGYEEALEYNLAKRFLTPYAVSDQTVIQGVVAGARESLANLKRANTRQSDLWNDAAGIGRNRGGWYSIQTDTRY